MIDLRNAREEAIEVADSKSNQDHSRLTEKKDADNLAKPCSKNEDNRKSSTPSEISIDADDDDDKETKYRLDPKYK